MSVARKHVQSLGLRIQPTTISRQTFKHPPIPPHPVYKTPHSQADPGYPPASRHAPPHVLRDQSSSSDAVPTQEKTKEKTRPLRRNILVADACERMWPPIGLRAPPATNVMVAPGSA
ncbi:hypothetical protein BDV98DRAFT_136911 [Pterulicium gracile]|uniref:Uncharacterized protein n=1 Tax=Pterulicium gracile TaxID=1884261 RepID=A0A5C3QVT1_9AGAR|nr:hypothetical protein BDV98DRAFT_136911 [Pterula gracilis]